MPSGLAFQGAAPLVQCTYEALHEQPGAAAFCGSARRRGARRHGRHRPARRAVRPACGAGGPPSACPSVPLRVYRSRSSRGAVDLGVVEDRLAFPRSSTQVILLDTNALLWIHAKHRRAAPLFRTAQRLYLSPASLLELQLLIESGRVREKPGARISSIAGDDRWILDDPSSAAWFERAVAESWTRDPFDRLLVAHARLRGWRLATGDGRLLERLSASERFEL